MTVDEIKEAVNELIHECHRHTCCSSNCPFYITGNSNSSCTFHIGNKNEYFPTAIKINHVN